MEAGWHSNLFNKIQEIQNWVAESRDSSKTEVPPRTWVRAVICEVDSRDLNEAKVRLKNEHSNRRFVQKWPRLKGESTKRILGRTIQTCPGEGNLSHERVSSSWEIKSSLCFAVKGSTGYLGVAGMVHVKTCGL